jgi:hypothetical protein
MPALKAVGRFKFKFFTGKTSTQSDATITLSVARRCAVKRTLVRGIVGCVSSACNVASISCGYWFPNRKDGVAARAAIAPDDSTDSFASAQIIACRFATRQRFCVVAPWLGMISLAVILLEHVRVNGCARFQKTATRYP